MYLNRRGLLRESADHQLRAKGVSVEIDGRGLGELNS